jgi:hypothetical protein
VTAGGVLFVGSTDDNRFRAIEAKTGKQLWLTKLDRRAKRQSDHFSRQERQAVRRDCGNRNAGRLRASLTLSILFSAQISNHLELELFQSQSMAETRYQFIAGDPQLGEFVHKPGLQPDSWLVLPLVRSLYEWLVMRVVLLFILNGKGTQPQETVRFG